MGRWVRPEWVAPLIPVGCPIGDKYDPPDGDTHFHLVGNPTRHISDQMMVPEWASRVIHWRTELVLEPADE